MSGKEMTEMNQGDTCLLSLQKVVKKSVTSSDTASDTHYPGGGSNDIPVWGSEPRLVSSPGLGFLVWTTWVTFCIPPRKSFRDSQKQEKKANIY